MTPRLARFRRLYLEQYGFVWATVRRFGVDPSVVDDAVQDAFVIAYRRMDEFRADRSRSWLYGIARRVASNYRRTAARAVRKQRAAVEVARSSNSVSGSDGAMEFDVILRELPPKDRELFVLAELEGLTGAELSEALHVPLATVYRRLRALRQDMAERLVADARVLDREREERPRPTAASWAMLVPALSSAAAVSSTIPMLAACVGVIASISIGVSIPIVREHSSSPMRVVAVRSTAPEPNVVPATPVLRPPLPVESPAPPSRESEAKRRAPTAKIVMPAAALPRASLFAQTEALRGGWDALRAGHSDHALMLTEELLQRFPHGPFEDSAQALRVEALCAQGKTREARSQAEAWFERHPTSPMIGRIQQSCARRNGD